MAAWETQFRTNDSIVVEGGLEDEGREVASSGAEAAEKSGLRSNKGVGEAKGQGQHSCQRYPPSSISPS